MDKHIFEICLRQLEIPGCVLLLPTETVYGLVCVWEDMPAVERIRRMKLRDGDKPFQMLAPDLESLIDYGVKITPEIRKVVNKFCPGPITIIADIQKTSPMGMKTVGFRIPDFPFLLNLMKSSGKLLAATSANIAGQPPSATVSEALKSFDEQPDIAVDGGRIEGKASTVVDMTGRSFKILREGAIRKEDLDKLFSEPI
jgi:L-threonylcarbamoyladenylate synthase